jgi:hypothetical protein
VAKSADENEIKRAYRKVWWLSVVFECCLDDSYRPLFYLSWH